MMPKLCLRPFFQQRLPKTRNSSFVQLKENAIDRNQRRGERVRLNSFR